MAGGSWARGLCTSVMVKWRDSKGEVLWSRCGDVTDYPAWGDTLTTDLLLLKTDPGKPWHDISDAVRGQCLCEHGGWLC